MKISKDEIINQIDKNWSEERIIKFVHIELGKQLIYDNSFSANNQDKDNDKSDMTLMSKKRRENLRYATTNLDTIEQVCKGMEEISAAIFNELGMQAKVIGVESKGDIDGAIKENTNETIVVPEIYTATFDGNNIVIGENEQKKKTSTIAKHFYTEIYRDGNDSIIQEYLMENALARIKMGESVIEDDMIPGLCTEKDYENRVEKSIPIKDEFKEKVSLELEQKYRDEINVNNKIDFIFKKIKQENSELGFEETKDYFEVLLDDIINSEEQNQIENNRSRCNLIKETENNADVVCIYNIIDRNYFVRGNINRLKELPQVGEVTEEQINEILGKGFEPIGKKDKEFLENKINNYVFETSQEKLDNYTKENDSPYINEFGEIIRPNNTKCFTPSKIGETTINVPTQAKHDAQRVEAEKDKMNERKSIDNI